VDRLAGRANILKHLIRKLGPWFRQLEEIVAALLCHDGVVAFESDIRRILVDDAGETGPS
jgi:hypothetical protein